jgi:hypothetical protein
MDDTVLRGGRRVGVVALVLVALASATLAAVGTAVALDGFTDVQPGSTHEAGIDWLVENRITSGCADSRYCPNDPVTRAQMGTFMHRLSGNAVGIDPSVDAATLEGRSAEELARPRAAAYVTTGATPQLREDSYGFLSVTFLVGGIYCVVPEQPELVSAFGVVQSVGAPVASSRLFGACEGAGGRPGIAIEFAGSVDPDFMLVVP